MHKLLTNPLVLLRGVMAFVFVALGFFLLVQPYRLAILNREYRGLFAGLIVTYGLFRMYRFYLDVKALNHEEK